MSERRPALGPTEPATLVVAGLATAAAAWLLISNFYQHLPPMSWPSVVLLGVLAVVEAVIAQRLWRRLRRPPPASARIGGAVRPPVEPLLVARFAVLAKATSIAGAIFTGWYAGLLPWLAMESGRLTGAAADLPPTIGGLVASVALVAAAWWLERACRIPPEDEQRRDARDRAEQERRRDARDRADGERRGRPDPRSGSGSDR